MNSIQNSWIKEENFVIKIKVCDDNGDGRATSPMATIILTEQIEFSIKICVLPFEVHYLPINLIIFYSHAFLSPQLHLGGICGRQKITQHEIPFVHVYFPVS